MSNLAYSWHALWSMRFVKVLAVSAVALTVLGASALSLALAAVPEAGLESDALFVTLLRTNLAVPIVSAVLAVAAVGSDVGRGLVLPALLRAGGRERAWLARLGTACAVSALLALTCVGTTVVVVTAISGPVSLDVAVRTAAGVVALALGWACVGVGVGSVIRHQFAAAAIPVVVAYLVEPLVRTTAALGPKPLEAIGSHLPFRSGLELVRGNATTARAVAESANAWHLSATVFLAFALAAAAGGFLVFRRADLVPTDVA